MTELEALRRRIDLVIRLYRTGAQTRELIDTLTLPAAGRGRNLS